MFNRTSCAVILSLLTVFFVQDARSQQCKVVGWGNNRGACLQRGATCNPIDSGYGATGKCKQILTAPNNETECRCNGTPNPSVTLSANPSAFGSVYPGRSLTSTITIAGATQALNVGCLPGRVKCVPNKSNDQYAFDMTVTVPLNTPAGEYSVYGTAQLNGNDMADPVPVYLRVVTPIAYSEVVRGIRTCSSSSSGCSKLADVDFPVDYTLVLSLLGGIEDIATFTVQVNSAIQVVGAENFPTDSETASVELEDDGNGTVWAQGDFPRSAGIFVSVDDTNSSIGFGSAGGPPTSASFPGQPVYPFAFRHPAGLAEWYSLSTDYVSPSTSSAFSCFGFPGPCLDPPPLPTNRGDLLIYTGFASGPFVAATSFYTLAVSSLLPTTIGQNGQATATITLTPYGKYKGTVSLGCNSMPIPGAITAQCGIEPKSVALDNAQMPATLTITTNNAAIGDWSFAVTGADTDGRRPANGAQVLTFSVGP